MARKVVGVGSVGTRAWVALMMGRDGQDPLFLQAKEAEASVLEPYLGASEFGNHGERVVEGQWLMQASSDILLGWLPAIAWEGGERDFYVRQLWDGKRSVEIETLPPEGLEIYGRVCGWTLARSPRTIRRPDRDRRLPWQGRRASIRRSPSSPSATPTRTSSITPRSPTRPSRGASRLRRTSTSGAASVGSIDRGRTGPIPLVGLRQSHRTAGWPRGAGSNWLSEAGC